MPFTLAVMALLLGTSLLLKLDDGDADGIEWWASTNIHNLRHHPLGSTVASAFVVRDGLPAELLMVAATFFAVERVCGSRRAIEVAVGGHVIATLVTEGSVAVGVGAHLLPASELLRSDIGVSYAMYAMVAAAVLLLPGRPRAVLMAGLSGLLTFGLLQSVDMTTVGHGLSAVVGVGVMRLPHQRRVRAD